MTINSKLPTILIAVCLLPPSGASAGEESDPAPDANPANRSPYQVSLGLDLGLTVGSAVVFGLPTLLSDQATEPHCGLGCDPDRVNSLDRHVIGNHSGTADLVSDVGLWTSFGLPFVLGAIDILASDPLDGWAGYGVDSLVLLQAVSITAGVTSLVKHAVRRPRPRVYDDFFDDESRLDGGSAMSFPSGHTSISFAMATAYSYTFMLRHPDSSLVVPVWLGTYALATATGILRTEAGAHFYTDVLAGAVLGVGIGLLVPYLHLRRDTPTVDRDQDDECFDEDPPVIVTVSPMITPGGIGAALTLR